MSESEDAAVEAVTKADLQRQVVELRQEVEELREQQRNQCAVEVRAPEHEAGVEDVFVQGIPIGPSIKSKVGEQRLQNDLDDFSEAILGVHFFDDDREFEERRAAAIDELQEKLKRIDEAQDRLEHVREELDEFREELVSGKQTKHQKKDAILREALRRSNPDDQHGLIDKSGAATAAGCSDRWARKLFKQIAEEHHWATYDPDGGSQARLKLDFKPDARSFAGRCDFSGVWE